MINITAIIELTGYNIDNKNEPGEDDRYGNKKNSSN